MNRSRAIAIYSEGAAPKRLLVILNLLTVLLVLFTLAACGGGKEQSEDLSEAQEPVQVELVGHDIEMPDSLYAGLVTFEVTNGGDTVHGFEVAGPGMDEEIEGIPPGETRTLQVDLQPGTYRVYCPVADHGQKGMELPLKVLPREEAT
jgi:hypothetical protein